jgi:hypothetical protein
LLSLREIDGDERQGDTLLGEEHAHTSRIGGCLRVIQLDCIGP